MGRLRRAELEHLRGLRAVAVDGDALQALPSRDRVRVRKYGDACLRSLQTDVTRPHALTFDLGQPRLQPSSNIGLRQVKERRVIEILKDFRKASSRSLRRRASPSKTMTTS